MAEAVTTTPSPKNARPVGDRDQDDEHQQHPHDRAVAAHRDLRGRRTPRSPRFRTRPLPVHVSRFLHRVSAAERLGVVATSTWLLSALLAGSWMGHCLPPLSLYQSPKTPKPQIPKACGGTPQRLPCSPDCFFLPRRQRRPQIVAVHERDRVDADLLGTRVLALTVQRAMSEPFKVHLRDHARAAAISLSLSLRKQTEVRDLCRG